MGAVSLIAATAAIAGGGISLVTKDKPNPDTTECEG
jgi:hypothetical protein